MFLLFVELILISFDFASTGKSFRVFLPLPRTEYGLKWQMPFGIIPNKGSQNLITRRNTKSEKVEIAIVCIGSGNIYNIITRNIGHYADRKICFPECKGMFRAVNMHTAHGNVQQQYLI